MGRLVYTLSEAESALPWTPTVALIGDGPGKLRYIYNQERVMTIAINKAAFHYPANFMVCVHSHFDGMIVQSGSRWRKPIIYLTQADLLKYRVETQHGIWTAVSMLIYLLGRDDITRVYLQGISCDSSPYDQQIRHFSAIEQFNPASRKVVVVEPGAIAGVFPHSTPRAEDIL